MTDTVSCQVDDASYPNEFNSLTEKIALWAASNHFWQIKSLVKSNDGFTLLVGPNILNHDLQDIFDDDRIGQAVQAGQKIPTIDDHWQTLYRRETKEIQAFFMPEKVWVTQNLSGSFKLLWSNQNENLKPTKTFIKKKKNTKRP